MLKTIGTFEFSLQQRERFKSAELWREWSKQYPDIFDEQDIGIAEHQAPPPMGYHFFEWLAAILLHHSIGYLSLLEQYEFRVQKRKQAILQKLVSPALFELITNHHESYGGTQCPDLLVYAPDLSDWFFCEVKGSGDELTDSQARFFEALANVSQKEIGVVRFQQAQLIRA
jgi:hypothetical protein